MADEIIIKAPTIEQGVNITISGEEKLKGFANTLNEIANGSKLQNYWKTQEELIRNTIQAYKEFERFSSADNAKNFVNNINALKAVANEDISGMFSGFDKMSESLSRAQDMVGKFVSGYSTANFKEAFSSFEMMQAYGLDMEETFKRLGSSTDIQALKNKIAELTTELEASAQAYSDLQEKYNSSLNTGRIEELEDEISSLNIEIETMRNRAEKEFRSYLSANDINVGNFDLIDYFADIQNGSMTAKEAIAKFKDECLGLGVKSGEYKLIDVAEFEALQTQIAAVMATLEEMYSFVREANGAIGDGKSVTVINETAAAVQRQSEALNTESSSAQAASDATSKLANAFNNAGTEGNEFAQNLTQLVGLLKEFGVIGDSSLEGLMNVFLSLGRLKEFDFKPQAVNDLAEALGRLTNISDIPYLSIVSGLHFEGLNNLHVSKASLNNLATYLPTIASVNVSGLSSLSKIDFSNLNNLKISKSSIANLSELTTAINNIKFDSAQFGKDLSTAIGNIAAQTVVIKADQNELEGSINQAVSNASKNIQPIQIHPDQGSLQKEIEDALKQVSSQSLNIKVNRKFLEEQISSILKMGNGGNGGGNSTSPILNLDTKAYNDALTKAQNVKKQITEALRVNDHSSVGNSGAFQTELNNVDALITLLQGGKMEAKDFELRLSEIKATLATLKADPSQINILNENEAVKTVNQALTRQASLLREITTIQLQQQKGDNSPETADRLRSLTDEYEALNNKIETNQQFMQTDITLLDGYSKRAAAAAKQAADLANATNKTDKGQTTERIRDQITLMKELQEQIHQMNMENLTAEYDADDPDRHAELQKLIADYAALEAAIKNEAAAHGININELKEYKALQDQIRKNNKEFAAESKQQTLQNNLLKEASTNLDKLQKQTASFGKNSKTAYSSAYKELVRLTTEYQTLYNKMQNTKDPAELMQIKNRLADISKEAEAAGQKLQGMGSKVGFFGQMMQTYLAPMMLFMRAVSQIKEMINTSIELESVLSDLQIVTKASSSDITEYGKSAANTAKELGVATKDVITATTTFARLGFNLDESDALAKYTTMLEKVGNIDSSAAEDAVTAIMMAFKDTAGIDNIESVMDKLVVVGNNFPISVSQLAEGMNNASSALAASGNSLEQSIALLTASNATIQDAAKSSTALRTITARLRKTDTELEALGEEAMTSAHYEEILNVLSKQNVTIKDMNGNYRSTYDILGDIAKVWDSLTSGEQAGIAEAVSGTRQQAVFFSMMQNWNLAEEAMKKMEGAAGEMSEAYSVYTDTTAAHINSLKAAWDELSMSLFESDVLKFFVDLAQGIVNALSSVVEFINTIGGVKVIIEGIGIALAALALANLPVILGAIAAALPYVALVACGTALAVLIERTKEAGHQFEKFKEEVSELNAEYDKNFGTGSRYDELINKVEILTQKEQDELAVLRDQADALREKIKLAEEEEFMAYQREHGYLAKAPATGETVANEDGSLSWVEPADLRYDIELLNDLSTAVQEVQTQYKEGSLTLSQYGSGLAKIIDTQKDSYVTLKHFQDMGFELSQQQIDFIRLYEGISNVYNAVNKELNKPLDENPIDEKRNYILRELSQAEEYAGDAGKKLKATISGYSDEAVEACYDAVKKGAKSLAEVDMFKAAEDMVAAYLDEINNVPEQTIAVIARAQSELRKLGNDGNVNLVMRQLKGQISTALLEDAGWEDVGDGIATIFSSTFSNESGNIAFNLTPIIVDENGKPKGVLSPSELQKYAEDMISEFEKTGVVNDPLNLKIGATFFGDDAISDAVAVAERIHELHEGLLEGTLVADEYRRNIESLGKEFGMTFDEMIEKFGDSEQITAMATEYVEKYFEALHKGTREGQAEAEAYKSKIQGMAEVLNISFEEVIIGYGSLNDATNSQLKGFATLDDEIKSVTQSLDEYSKKLQEMGEKGDAAASMDKLYDQFLADWESGKTGTNAVRVAIQAILGDELWASLGYDVQKGGELLNSEFYKAIFANPDSNEYGLNFANYIKDNLSSVLGDAVSITDLGDGAYQFSYSSAKELAGALGISLDLTYALLDALDAFGVQVMAGDAEVRAFAEGLASIGEGAKVSTIDGLNAVILELVNMGYSADEVRDRLNMLSDAGYIRLNLDEYNQQIGTMINEAKDAKAGISDIVSSLNLSKSSVIENTDEINNLISTLASTNNYDAAGLTEVLKALESAGYIKLSNFDNLDDVVQAAVSSVQEGTETIEDTVEEADSEEIDITAEVNVDDAIANVDSLMSEIQALMDMPADKVITITTIHTEGGANGASVGGFTIGAGGGAPKAQNAAGTNYAHGGKTLLGDEYSAYGNPKPELVVQDGKAHLAGINGPVVENLKPGAVVYSNAETKKILKGDLIGSIPAFAGGNSDSSAFWQMLKDRIAQTNTTTSYNGATIPGGNNSGGNNNNNSGSGGSGGGSSGGSGSGGSGGSSAKVKTWFEIQLAKHQHLLKMEQETEEEYLEWLDEAYQKAYKEGILTLEDFYKYEEEVFDKRRELFKDYLNDIEHTISALERQAGTEKEQINLYQQMILNIQKQIQEARDYGLDDNSDYIQELTSQLWGYQDKIKDIEDSMSEDAKRAVKDLVDYRIQMLKKDIENEKAAISKRLSAIKEFYDKQKSLLNESKDEEDYISDQREKRENVAKLEEQLAQLEYDNSARAQKKRLELQESLADAQEELRKFERDHAISEAQKEYDRLYEIAEEAMNNQTEALDEQLNDAKGLYERALQDVRNGSVQLYEEMIAYNNKYGDGISETIVNKWKEAYDSLEAYNTLYGEYYKGIRLANVSDHPETLRVTGYASGTRNATAGLHRVYENGEEMIFESSNGNKYKMLSGGSRVMNASDTDFLYNLATNRNSIIAKMLSGSFSVNGLNSGQTTVGSITLGNIIINGNADEDTVSEIRRAQRENMDYMLKELARLKK